MYTINKIAIIVFILTLLSTPVNGEVAIDELIMFLDNDTTDQNRYTPYYSCGHFSRELSNNAKSANITIGSAILGNTRYFNGYANHILNYYVINETYYFIEPQTDMLLTMSAILVDYKFIKLYPDGTQVPSYWKHSIRPTIIRNDTDLTAIFLT